ncbi:MAG: ABC transporter permease [Ferruginibacter sp.]|nr:ABC transporter permease [Ferruginibacter sp.]
MNTIFTVLKKELKDTLRDRRTLISAVIIPALIIPLLLIGVTKLQRTLMKKEGDKQLKIAIIGNPENFRNHLEDSTFKMFTTYKLEDAKLAVSKDSLDAIIEFQPNFFANVNDMKSGKMNLYYKSTNFMLYSRISEKLEIIKSQILQERIQKLNISEEALIPFSVTKVDIATVKEQLGKMIGGFLPYIFIIFCFTACMYPAIDLITGEKEKGTMETLLSSPASRFQILIGKILTISIVGLSAALMTIVGMVVGLKFLPDIPADFLATINDIVSVKFIVMLFAMLIPLSIFFAGLLSAIVIRAKSFKEAQTMVTPMMFVIIIPAMLALIPGVVLNWQTTFIPVLNIALATKEIIAGTINIAMYAAIVLSLIGFALLAAFISYKQFSKESMVLK